MIIVSKYYKNPSRHIREEAFYDFRHTDTYTHAISSLNFLFPPLPYPLPNFDTGATTVTTYLLIEIGVGYKWVIFCFIFATVFLYSICPISTWNDLFFGLGAKKKVRRAKIQNGRRFPWKITFSAITLSFVGLFVWFWCLTLCFGGQRFHLCS